MRRLVPVLIIVLVLAGLWAVGWFWLASWAERNVERVLAEIRERGVAVDCADRDVVGFPFALKLTCGPTSVAEQASQTQAQLAGLTGGASVFAPRTAQIALASPARVESPLLAAPADVRWDNADVGVGMGLNGPQTVSFEAVNISGNLPLAALPQASASAATASAELEPTADGRTNAGFAFTRLALTVAGTALPPFDGYGSALLSVPPRALLAGRAALQAPISAQGVDVNLSAGDARLQAAGDVSVDSEGIVDGTITLRVAGSEALPALLATLPPEQQKAGNAAIGAMIAFGSPTTLDGERASELVVEIVRGRARIGPVEVTVPRLPI